MRTDDFQSEARSIASEAQARRAVPVLQRMVSLLDRAITPPRTLPERERATDRALAAEREQAASDALARADSAQRRGRREVIEALASLEHDCKLYFRGDEVELLPAQGTPVVGVAPILVFLDLEHPESPDE